MNLLKKFIIIFISAGGFSKKIRLLLYNNIFTDFPLKNYVIKDTCFHRKILRLGVGVEVGAGFVVWVDVNVEVFIEAGFGIGVRFRVWVDVNFEVFIEAGGLGVRIG